MRGRSSGTEVLLAGVRPGADSLAAHAESSAGVLTAHAECEAPHTFVLVFRVRESFGP